LICINASGAGWSLHASLRIWRNPLAADEMRGAAMKTVLQAIVFALLLLATAHAQTPKLDNATCLSCHGKAGFATSGANARSLYVAAAPLAHSVHGSLPCVACHTAITAIPHTNAPMTLAQWRRQVPKMCGTCHADVLTDYDRSTHAKALAGGNLRTAVCTDCHSAHAVAQVQTPAARLAITKACGNCHKASMASYQQTYHGKLFTLGYAYIATCADCHRGHAILPASDPASSIASPRRRLGTCRTCHRNAPFGFATFEAHATTNDFARYPYNWIASKFVWMLIIGTFSVFWTHSLLWFYRELRDRRQRRPRPHVRAEAVPKGARYVERWSAAWRWAHFFFASSVIALIMTSLPLLYPNAAWAPVLIRILGGPTIADTIHRVAAVVMTTVFVAHLVYIGVHLWRNWKNVRLFGPYSLLPTWQDGYDILAMLKWFFGRAPRPVFDHWNYQQKFDYWAPFWGVAIIGTSGLILFYPALTSHLLPGWVFNIATIAHSEEALLAAVFLFTVHFFNANFRPDKFPMSTSIFTGAVPLEEFKFDHALAYERLRASGELEKYLVKPPSAFMAKGARLLSAALIFASLTLLILVLYGYWAMHG
jgi:cytochrome b subunit of formate dehydrogenase/nitrate/TMAO reductase-like tetraheme cytochrome c subunit